MEGFQRRNNVLSQEVMEISNTPSEIAVRQKTPSYVGCRRVCGQGNKSARTEDWKTELILGNFHNKRWCDFLLR